MSLTGIALVSREYPPFFGGGIGTYAAHVAPALAAAGVRVHVVTQAFDETHPRYAERDGVAVHRVPFPGSPASRTAGLLRFAAESGRVVADLAARGAIDVVEFAECEAAGAILTMLDRAGSTLAPRLGAPSVVHLHTPTEMLFRLGSIHDREMSAGLAAHVLFERASLLAADHVCAPSRFIAAWAQGHYDLPATPTVVPYAIRGLPDIPRVAPRRRRVLHVGRIEPRKGVEPLVRAWMRVAPSHPGWTLRLVGGDTRTGPAGGSMRAAIRALLPSRLAGTVELVDGVPPALLAREYAAAAVCVIPSLWENFPNTCIEAMSFARPVVISDEGGMREMVGDTDAGVTFRSGDADDLVRVLGGLLDEPAERLAARGLRGRERIAALCDPAVVARQRVAMYESVRDGARRGMTRPTRGRPVSTRRGWHDLWRHAQDVSARRSPDLGLPALPHRLARWLEETPTCV
jgi:glycosyltransferase involved in cell wall biosynthesis